MAKKKTSKTTKSTNDNEQLPIQPDNPTDEKVKEFLGDDYDPETDSVEARKSKSEDEVVDDSQEDSQPSEDVETQSEEPQESVEEGKSETDVDTDVEENEKVDTAEKVDTDKLKDEARKEVVSDIVKALTGGKTSDEVKKEGFEFAWEKEGRNPKDYVELAKESARYNQYLKEQEDQKAQQEATMTVEQEKKVKEEWNKKWDNQLASLRKDEGFPQVSKEAAELVKRGAPYTEEEQQVLNNDKGRQAERELFTISLQNNETDLEKVYYKHYAKKRKQPAGADAPVSGGNRPSIAGEVKGGYSYEDLHNKSFEDILRGDS